MHFGKMEMDRAFESRKQRDLFSLSFFSFATSTVTTSTSPPLKPPLFKKQTKKRLLRHGRSKPNEAGLIVSTLKNGTKREHGLSATGREQAKEAG